MPGQPQPVAAQPADGAGYPGAGPYVSNQGPQAAAGNLGETAAGRPIDPAVHQRRPPASRLVPILVGVVALLLLGGGAAAFVLLGRKPADGTTAASSSASASAAPDDTGSAAPADTGSAAPADTGSAAPADTAAPAASGEPDAGPAEPESTLACDPECDEIKLDDKPIELGKPLVILEGKHRVVATKSGYVTVKETIVVKAGDKVEKTFKLKEKPTAPAVPAGPVNTPPKPCGKFLKRCK
jgi:hypothetical protein